MAAPSCANTKLIETLVENSHHNAAKPFGKGALPKGQLINAKSAQMGMLLERIQNGGSLESTNGPTQHPQRFRRTRPCLTSRSIAMHQLLKIQPSQSRLPIMAIQGQGMFRQGPSRGPTQQGRLITCNLNMQLHDY